MAIPSRQISDFTLDKNQDGSGIILSGNNTAKGG